MKIIEKIEIKNFRSFGNKKGTSVQIKAISDLNILSGANDSGKSNVLRALNLFFNKQSNIADFFNFERDYFKRESKSDDDVQQEIVTVKVWFNNYKNKERNSKHSKQIYLPQKFWVTRSWRKTDIYTNYAQKDSTLTDLKRESPTKYNTLIASKRKEGNFKNQLTKFLDSIQYYYVPAIKDSEYYSHLYGELQQTLWKFKNSEIEQKKNDFETTIQNETNLLMQDFERSVNKFLPDHTQISSVFEMPKDLINFFKTLLVQTDKIDLKHRGDGVQAKIIPEILNFIAQKESEINNSNLKVGEKNKKYFVWGFEEPENSYEYRNAQLLADKFRDDFSKNAQIFLTTHSFNFLSLNETNISRYHIYKNTHDSSEIKKIISDNRNDEFHMDEHQSDEDILFDALGLFSLSNELDKIYKKKLNEISNIKTKKREIELVLTEHSIIKKPIIYSEGHNFRILEKAKNIIAPHLNISFYDGGGDKEMKLLFRTYSENKHNLKRIFVFDCDSVQAFESCERIGTNNILAYRFFKNENNTRCSKGIENLFPSKLFSEEFYSTKIETDDYGAKKSIQNFDKNKFSEHIVNIPDDPNIFKNFEPLFEFLNNVLIAKTSKT